MRYQFEPRGGYDHVVRSIASAICKDMGATRICEAFPICYETNGTRVVSKGKRLNNQPRTIAFTAKHDGIAKKISLAYGDDAAFVWNITEKHYV